MGQRTADPVPLPHGPRAHGVMVPKMQGARVTIYDHITNSYESTLGEQLG